MRIVGQEAVSMAQRHQVSQTIGYKVSNFAHVLTSHDTASATPAMCSMLLIPNHSQSLKKGKHVFGCVGGTAECMPAALPAALASEIVYHDKASDRAHEILPDACDCYGQIAVDAMEDFVDYVCTQLQNAQSGQHGYIEAHPRREMYEEIVLEEIPHADEPLHTAFDHDACVSTLSHIEIAYRANKHMIHIVGWHDVVIADHDLDYLHRHDHTRLVRLGDDHHTTLPFAVTKSTKRILDHHYTN